MPERRVILAVEAVRTLAPGNDHVPLVELDPHDAGHGLLGGDPNYLKFCNQQTFLFVQIETRQALDAVDEIAAVAGVDALFVGRGDLSLSLGIQPGSDTVEMKRCLKRVAKAVEANGKSWGTPAGSTEETKMLLDMGARFFAHAAFS